MNDPTITMSGYNPQTPPLMIQKMKATPNGFGYALSQAVQFNVNKDAPPGGALFVGPNNDGVVKVTLTSQHVFDDAWALFPSSANQIGMPRVEIATSIAANKKAVTFSVRTGDAAQLVFTTAFVLQFAPDERVP